MKSSRLLTATLGSLVAAGLLAGVPAPAKADTASTAAIAVGAAAIVGALLYDNNNRPYYVRGGHRYYVTHDQALYYRQHHGGQVHAYAPAPRYTVTHTRHVNAAPQRMPARMNQQRGGMHGGGQHGNGGAHGDHHR